MVKFSVLMSIYAKENPLYFAECMESLLAQTYPADEIVLVEDGPLTDELYAAIEAYKERCNLKVVVNEENMGLGLSLARGITYCSNELIARMDTDDISVKDRFEKQIAYFKEHKNTDVLGGYIKEFSDDVEEITGVREVPLSCKEIYRYQRKRDGLNHVTVMFRKSAVLAAGNYQHCLLMEDSLLWANMIKNHARMANLADTLVLVRTGDDMLKRRGGFDYFLKYKKGRKAILETGTISRFDYAFTVAVQLVVCMVPLKLREFIFNRILRK